MTDKPPTDSNRQREISDIYAAALPDALAMDWRLGGRHRDEVVAWLNFNARLKVLQQFYGRYPVPKDVEMLEFEWLITDSPHDAAQFTIAHECQDCRDGLQKAVKFLEDTKEAREKKVADAAADGEHIGVGPALDMPVIALANLKYKETWV